MEERSLQKLEFHKIREMVSERASSGKAKQAAVELSPSCDIFEIRHLQDQTDEALRYIYAKGAPSFNGIKDIRGSVKRTEIGACLTMGELLDIAECLYVVSRIQAYGNRENRMQGDFPELDPLFQGLIEVNDLEEEIRRCILSEEELYDTASPKLHKIRKEITIQETRIQSQLQNMVHSEAYKGYLQDQIVTMRGGRYCLPVKAEYKTVVTGMVHDQSASGSTFFIEPMAVVQMNNRISELLLEEKEEILRILQELSGHVHEHNEKILLDFTILTDLDFIFAKAKLAKEMNAVKPIFNEDGQIQIRKARHPLIPKKSVVPIDLRLGDEFTTLVITGPNTGGKTVTLKTLGLLQLMGQSGLHIPAAENPSLTVLDQVFADIGDEQSIEQSLSTFSSHMVNIVSILKQVTYHSLVLFDELGAGTDPTEGAALAQSILEYLRERAILTAATTHYSELKIYALSTERVENASCEFNVETLMPTYRLMIGLPGKSNAFAISRRLGLSEEIIQKAGDLLESNDIQFEDMISDLEAKRKAIEFEKMEIDRLHREAAELEKANQQQKEELDRKAKKTVEAAKEKAKEIIDQAKAEADHAISKVNKALRQGTNVNMKVLEEERRKLRERSNDLTPELFKAEEPKSSFSLSDLIPGTRIRVSGFDQPFSILSAPDSKGTLKAQAGILKMQVKVDDILGIISDVPSGKNKKNIQRTADSSTVSKSASVKIECDLRGMMTDEGIAVLDKYLDDATLAGIPSVRIIHGKGTGAMRKAVQQYLKRCSYVTSFRLGNMGEGDSGVTVAELKNRSNA